MNGVYYNFDELKQVDFEKISSKKVVHINNICTFDIECSNGFRLDNGKVIAFSFNRWRKWNRENQARIDAGLRLFLPGKSHGQRSLVGYSPWGRKSRTQLSD